MYIMFIWHALHKQDTGTVSFLSCTHSLYLGQGFICQTMSQAIIRDKDLPHSWYDWRRNGNSGVTFGSYMKPQS